MKGKIIFISVIFVLLIFTVGGCGAKEEVQKDNNSQQGEQVTKTSDNLLDPSLLLSKEDAEVVLGETAGDPEIIENKMGQKVYTYSPAQLGTAVRFVQISVFQTSAMPDELKDSGYSAAKHYDDCIGFLDEGQEINDLGDRAFWGGSGLKMGAGLHVLQGDVYFSISTALGNEADDFIKCKELAEKVLSRL